MNSFLGSRAVRFTTIHVHGKAACLALSTRGYLTYTYQVRSQLNLSSETSILDDNLRLSEFRSS